MISETLSVKVCQLRDIKHLVEEHHYSKSVNGLKVSVCFALFYGEMLVGCLIFGELSTTAWKKYGMSEKDVVELRRMVVIKGIQKNACTFMMAKALKVLKKEYGYKVVVSYADPYHGHIGIVYQAANWNYVGKTSPDILLKTPDGKLYHSRAMRTKYKGNLKPFAARLQELNDQGLLESVKVPAKHVYTYTLTGKHVCTTSKQYPKAQDDEYFRN